MGAVCSCLEKKASWRSLRAILSGDISVPVTWSMIQKNSGYAVSLGSLAIPIVLWGALQAGLLKTLSIGQGSLLPGLKHATSIKLSAILTSPHLESLPSLNLTSPPPRNLLCDSAW